MRFLHTLILALTLSLGGFAQAQTVQPLAGVDATVAQWDTQKFWDLLQPAQGYDCSRKTCGQIRSCEEACYKLQVCGHTERDGDGDGIPCESLCSRRC